MGGPEPVPELREWSIYAMHQAGEGEVWFAGDEGAMRFDPDADDWQAEPAVDALSARRVTDIVEDETGLWFGTYGGGVAFYDGSRWETLALDAELGGNLIQAIRQDGEGAIWFTHQGTGLSRYEPEGGVWQVFGEAEGALDWPCVPAVDSSGSLWIADYGELARYDGQGWQTFTPPELEGIEIYEIEIGPDDVRWLVTDHGLMRHNPATEEWTTFTGADHPVMEEIWSILAASDGTVWVGGEEDIARYDGSTWSPPEASGSAPRNVEDFAEGSDGSLWIAADGELWHLAGGRWSYSAWTGDAWLETVAIGPDGSVWAGYVGLGRYDPASGDWEMGTPDDGLVHSIVQAIHVTPEGVVWIGTEGGVSRYVPPD
jgi:ligand-binding sensor domain-containing protein